MIAARRSCSSRPARSTWPSEPPAVTTGRGGAQAPAFQADPLWPKPLPNHWILGSVTGVAVDSAGPHLARASRPRFADRTHRSRHGHESADRGRLLRAGAAGARVRRHRRPRQSLGRTGTGLRLAGLARRHRRRRQGQRLDYGGRAETTSDATSRGGAAARLAAAAARSGGGGGRPVAGGGGAAAGGGGAAGGAAARRRSAAHRRGGGWRRGAKRRSGGAARRRPADGRARPQVLARRQVPPADRQGRAAGRQATARRRSTVPPTSPSTRRPTRCTSPTAARISASSSSTRRPAPTNGIGAATRHRGFATAACSVRSRSVEGRPGLRLRSREQPHPGLQEGRHVRQGRRRLEGDARRRIGVGHRVLERRTAAVPVRADGRTSASSSSIATRSRRCRSFGDGGRQPGLFRGVGSVGDRLEGQPLYGRDLRREACTEVGRRSSAMTP